MKFYETSYKSAILDRMIAKYEKNYLKKISFKLLITLVSGIHIASEDFSIFYSIPNNLLLKCKILCNLFSPIFMIKEIKLIRVF